MKCSALLLLAACGPEGKTPHIDARLIADSAATDTNPQLYRHTIALDGIDDFATREQFPTTSTYFVARVTWDDANLYVGYGGPDLTPATGDAGTKWLFIYLDTIAGGELQSQMYNTQRATFPAGFAADYYVRYKVDGTYSTLERNDAGTWNTATPGPTTAQAGTFLELAIPLTSIAADTRLGLVTWMINEKALVEGSYAGLFADNFVDGYSTNLALTAYLEADFTSLRSPNDTQNRRP
jgi:hypothetical protein